jgi:hypothetical protein
MESKETIEEINKQDEEGDTRLHRLLKTEGSLKDIEALIEDGASVDIKNNKGQTVRELIHTCEMAFKDIHETFTGDDVKCIAGTISIMTEDEDVRTSQKTSVIVPPRPMLPLEFDYTSVPDTKKRKTEDVKPDEQESKKKKVDEEPVYHLSQTTCRGKECDI